MVLTNAYATLSALKSRLSLTADNPTVDAMLEQTILAASRQIDGMTGDFFSPVASSTRVFTADDTGYLSVPSLRAVTALATDDDGDRVYETTWATTDYDLEPVDAAYDGRPYTSIRLAPNGNYTFPRLSRGVQITGTWGWASVPNAITEATLILATRLFKRRDAPFGVAGSPELGTAQFIARNDPDVRALIDPYRRFSLTGV